MSVFAGFKRIQSNIERFKWNHQILYTNEQLGAFVSKGDGVHPLINNATGEVLHPEYIEQKVAHLKESLPEIEKQADQYIEQGFRWYKRRNQLLACGFLMLLLAKVWGAYTA